MSEEPRKRPVLVDPAEKGIVSTISSFLGGNYDPHVYRQVNNPTTDFETLVHFLKSSLGTGILAMPQAYARAGLVTGVLSTILVGVLITYCLHVLVNSQYALCKRYRVPLLTYPDSMAAALRTGPKCLHCCARCAPIIVDIFLVVYQLGICCIYIVFIAENLRVVFSPHFSISLEIYMVISMVPLIAINCIPNLKKLAPFSIFANVITFIGLAIILGYLLSTKKSYAPYDYWGTLQNFPLFFGTILFALVTVGVVIALENNMKTPKSFCKPTGVLNLAMFIIVVMYVTVGAIGYVFCVSECSDSITLDLPQGQWMATAVRILFVIAIFISYGLQCYVPVDVVWNYYVRPCFKPNSSKKKLMTAEYILRIFLCLLTFVFAIGVPRLGLFISLFGALCLSALGMCFPAIMDMCLSWAESKERRRRGLAPGGYLRRAKDALLFLIGIFGLVVGTYTAILAIVRSFQMLNVATTESSGGGGGLL